MGTDVGGRSSHAKEHSRSKASWIRLKKELATLGEELPPVALLPARSKKQSPDPTKRGSSREEFGRRVLAWGNMWDSLSCLMTLLESFNKNNPEMGIDSVARQMHHKTLQHYWVNIVMQQVAGGECPTLRDTLIISYPARCKTSSVSQSAGLSIPRSSVRFRRKLKKNLNLHGFDLHRPSSKGTKLLLQVIKASINQSR